VTIVPKVRNAVVKICHRKHTVRLEILRSFDIYINLKYFNNFTVLLQILRSFGIDVKLKNILT
jgi:hypothetical protein